MQVIAAIDIMEGKSVRLEQGDFARATWYKDKPLELAKAFEGAGLKRLHLVDLDGARKGRVVNWKVLETLVSRTSLELDFGGGLKTTEDLETVFGCGAAMASIGSVAVTDPALLGQWLSAYGAPRILVGADTREGIIEISGWTRSTGIAVMDFIQGLTGQGVNQIFCTDISKDGLLAGPAVELYEKVLEQFPHLKLIASGGVTRLEDMYRLDAAGCTGAIVGKALYEGKILLEDLQPFAY